MHSALNLKRQFLLNHVNSTFFLLSKDPTFSQLTEKKKINLLTPVRTVETKLCSQNSQGSV